MLTCLALGQSGTDSASSGPLTLRHALELGLLNSPVVQAAAADVRASNADVNAARSRLTPHLSANGFAGQGSYGTIFGSSPGVEPPYNLVVPSGSLLDQNFMLMVPLFTGGTLQFAVSSAKQIEGANRAMARDTQAEVGLTIIDAYLKVLQHIEMEKAHEAKIASAEELIRTTTAQVQTGDVVPASLQRVQAELARATRALTSERNEHDKAMLQLMRAMGLDLASSFSLTDSLQETKVTHSEVDYLRDAERNRASLLVASARKRAAESDLKAAQARYAPQLYFGGTADLSNRNGMSGAAAALTLSIPLYDGGERRAAISKAQANLERANAEERSARLLVESDVRSAWLDLNTADANLKSARTSVSASEEAYKVMHLRVVNGKSILLEELDALQTLTSDRADMAQALYDHEIAVVRLNRAAGLDLLAGVQ